MCTNLISLQGQELPKEESKAGASHPAILRAGQASHVCLGRPCRIQSVDDEPPLPSLKREQITTDLPIAVSAGGDQTSVQTRAHLQRENCLESNAPPRR